MCQPSVGSACRPLVGPKRRWGARIRLHFRIDLEVLFLFELLVATVDGRGLVVQHPDAPPVNAVLGVHFRARGESSGA